MGPALPLSSSSTSTFTTPSKHPKGQILVGANGRGKSFSLGKYLPLPSKQCHGLLIDEEITDAFYSH
jgi:signal recognition particle GTPase